METTRTGCCGSCEMTRPLRRDPYGGEDVCDVCYVPAPQPARERVVRDDATRFEFTLTLRVDERELLALTKRSPAGVWTPVARGDGWWRYWAREVAAGTCGFSAEADPVEVFFRPA